MTEALARQHIAAAIAEIAPEADLSMVDPKAPLRPQIDLDSMDFLRLLQALHRGCGVEVPEAEYARVSTLEALVAWVAQHAPGPG